MISLINIDKAYSSAGTVTITILLSGNNRTVIHNINYDQSGVGTDSVDIITKDSAECATGTTRTCSVILITDAGMLAVNNIYVYNCSRRISVITDCTTTINIGLTCVIYDYLTVISDSYTQVISSTAIHDTDRTTGRFYLI